MTVDADMKTAASGRRQEHPGPERDTGGERDAHRVVAGRPGRGSAAPCARSRG